MSRRLLALLLVVAAACSPAPAVAPAARPSLTTTPAAQPTTTPALSFPVTLSDFQGKSVLIARRPDRIVSVGPSNTEFLFALGAGDRVVGVDDFSDEPAAAKSKEKVGGVKVNAEKVLALRPDLVVSVKVTDGSLEKIAAQSITVLVVDPVGIPDAIRTAVLLGNAIGADGDGLARSMQERLDRVKQRAAALKKRRVFHEVDASDPTKPFTVGPGSFVHDLIELAGGVNIAARAPSPYPQLSAEEVVRADPEIIVLADADYGVTPEQVAARPGWSAISAVRTKRIVPVDANLMSRPGPRLPEAAETYFKIISETP